jgi:tRNA G46 methylase TrmB
MAAITAATKIRPSMMTTAITDTHKRTGPVTVSVMRTMLMQMFGRPRGVPGRLGGIIMAHTNADCGAWVTELLEIGPCDSVLEVGFGPGVIIQRLSKLAAAGHIAGIDPSQEMVAQARAECGSALVTNALPGMQPPSRMVVSTSGAALWSTCRSMTMPLIRRWQSTPCKSGRTLRLD